MTLHRRLGAESCCAQLLPGSGEIQEQVSESTKYYRTILVYHPTSTTAISVPIVIHSLELLVALRVTQCFVSCVELCCCATRQVAIAPPGTPNPKFEETY